MPGIEGLTDLLDTPLLVTLPVSILAKTGAFAWFVWTMRGQRNEGALGQSLVRLFFWLSLTSAMLALLFTVFAVRWYDADLSSWVLFMLPLETFIWFSVFYGWKVRAEYNAQDGRDCDCPEGAGEEAEPVARV
jgi:hypothetical protein